MIKTKIIATVGPACNRAETLSAMIDAGLDVVRLNFSHGTLADHTVALEQINRVARQHGTTIGVIGDLCGPKIRVGEIAGGQCEFEQGHPVTIQRAAVQGTSQRVSTNHPALIDDVAVGDRIFIDDGAVRLRAVDKRPDELICQVEVGGTVTGHKGVNVPDTRVSSPSLSPKDLQDLEWAIAHGVDYVAMSFVRSPEDLYELRRRLKERDSRMGVIAKIERPEAIEHIDEIIEHSDAVMVARGDLGVEMDPALVPLIQKDIVLKCQRHSVPVIIATQMLQSMVNSPMPTRAEVSDVANAILDGSDAVMLSAETSVGRYPVEAVTMMNRVAAQTEEFLSRSGPKLERQPPTTSLRVTSAVVHGAQLLANELGARLVGVWTESGFTARLISKRRLPQPIVGLSADERVCRLLTLYWGVVPIQATRPDDDNAMLVQLDHLFVDRGLASRGELIVVVAGTRLHKPGATNALLIHLVGMTPLPK
jgi:pyruvate kinase